MGNAIKYLKLQITHTPPDMPEDEVGCRMVLELELAVSLCTLSRALDSTVILYVKFLLNVLPCDSHGCRSLYLVTCT